MGRTEKRSVTADVGIRTTEQINMEQVMYKVCTLPIFLYMYFVKHIIKKEGVRAVSCCQT